METLDFFSSLQAMRGLRGDTFPTFYVRTDADDLTGCSMRLVLSDVRSPGSVALTKACTPCECPDGAQGFSVRLLTAETATLCGTYAMHFILNDGTGEERKLLGSLTVLDVPKEVL